MKKQIITVIGNVGSGKTTLVPILKKALKAETLDMDNLFQTKNPFRDTFLRDVKRWALASETWLVHERVKLAKKYFKKRKKSISIIDSGILMSWMYSYSHYLTGKMTKHEWKLFDKLYNELTKELPKDTVVIHLSYSIQTLLNRIKKRGRDYEVKQYDEYVRHLEEGLKGLVKKLKRSGIRVVTILEKHAPDFEKNQKDAEYIIGKIKKLIGGHY